MFGIILEVFGKILIFTFTNFLDIEEIDIHDIIQSCGFSVRSINVGFCEFVVHGVGFLYSL